MCFHGKPKYIWVDTDSLNNSPNHKRNVYDTKWNEITVEIGHKRNNSALFKKPKKLKKIINIAKILSKDFPHVRVDLYYVNNKIYFGELTFYSQNGMANFEPISWDYKMGKFIDIKKIKMNKIQEYLKFKKIENLILLFTLPYLVNMILLNNQFMFLKISTIFALPTIK